jgi:recombination protein RecA
MPATARAVSRDELEALLRLKKLDHTLTPLEPLGKLEKINDRWCLPTGMAGLDERLQGGVPRGHLSEVVGARSSGRLAVVLSALAGATQRGEAVAFIDPLDMFDPPSAAASGVDFSRLLWIRGEASSSARVSLMCEYGTLQKSLDRAVKSLNLVLQAGGFGLVVLDLADLPAQVLRRLPLTTWLRLHRVLEGSETACVLIGAAPISRSAGGVSVHLGQAEPKAQSPESRACISARVVRARALETPNVCLPVSAAAC